MTTPTIQTIHHEEIIFGGLPGERKVIIDTALIDGKFETMVMYDDGEELDSRVTTDEKQASIDFVKLLYMYAGDLQRAVIGANLQEGGKYTILSCGESGLPIAEKFTFHSMTCSTYAQYNDVMELTVTPYRGKNKSIITLCDTSFIILWGWHDLTEADIYNTIRETDKIKTMMSKYVGFDSRYIEDMEQNYQPFIIGIYKNYKTGVDGKTYA